MSVILEGVTWRARAILVQCVKLIKEHQKLSQLMSLGGAISRGRSRRKLWFGGSSFSAVTGLWGHRGVLDAWSGTHQLCDLRKATELSDPGFFICEAGTLCVTGFSSEKPLVSYGHALRKHVRKALLSFHVDPNSCLEDGRIKNP